MSKHLDFNWLWFDTLNNLIEFKNKKYKKNHLEKKNTIKNLRKFLKYLTNNFLRYKIILES